MMIGRRTIHASLMALALLWAQGAWGASPTTAPTTARSSLPESPTIVSQTAAGGGVTVVTLSNGLTVIVKPMRHVPVVTVQALVHTGSLYEGRWQGAGISHLLEHLVAKGAVHDMGPQATAAEAKQTTGRVEEIGGQSNAYTSLDRTSYYISAAAGKTDDCIDLVADWMARPEITREDFEREHGVVQRELEMGKDNPARQFWYANSANVFRGHPAAVPVIGYAEPLAKLTYEDVLAYHRQAYVPQNMVFLVVGDIDTPAVLERVRRAFAGMPAGRATDHTLPPVQPFVGVRRVTTPNAAVKDVMAEISFQTIPLLHADLYALDVLSYVLSQGRSSRLVDKIERQQQLVTSISSHSWTPAWGAGVFGVSYRAEPDKADAAEKAILAELSAIALNGVTEEELERAKRQKVADFVYANQTVDSVASSLGEDYLASGNVDFSRDYTDRIQSVTAQQVQAAARRYFTFDAMIVTRLVPQAMASSDTAPATTRPANGKARFFKLSNGLRVVLQPVPSAGLVSMTYASTGGLLLENQETNGLGTLMTTLSTRGAGHYSAEDIARFFDRAGGSIAGQTGNSTFYWQATVLQDSYEKALDILAAVVACPTFADKELETVRPVLLSRIAQQDEQWLSQLQRFFRSRFFAGDPYGMMPLGSEEVVQAATGPKLADWHKRSIRAGSGVLAVYGSFDADRARALIEKFFAAVPAGEVQPTLPPAVKLPPDGQYNLLPTQNKTAGIIVAAPSIKVTDLDDRFALDVLDTIVSGWQLPSGWLHTELRGKQLVYVVHAYNFMGLAPGAWVVYAAGEPENAPQIAQIIEKNLRKASTYEPSQREIDLAINTILTAELLNNQSLADLSMAAAIDELYGLGYGFRASLEKHYRQVRPADVQRVARQYLGGPYSITITTPTPQNMEKPK